jgi:hypothetical protein
LHIDPGCELAHREGRNAIALVQRPRGVQKLSNHRGTTSVNPRADNAFGT